MQVARGRTQLPLATSPSWTGAKRTPPCRATGRSVPLSAASPSLHSEIIILLLNTVQDGFLLCYKNSTVNMLAPAVVCVRLTIDLLGVYSVRSMTAPYDAVSSSFNGSISFAEVPSSCPFFFPSRPHQTKHSLTLLAALLRRVDAALVHRLPDYLQRDRYAYRPLCSVL